MHSRKYRLSKKVNVNKYNYNSILSGPFLCINLLLFLYITTLQLRALMNNITFHKETHFATRYLSSQRAKIYLHLTVVPHVFKCYLHIINIHLSITCLCHTFLTFYNYDITLNEWMFNVAVNVEKIMKERKQPIEVILPVPWFSNTSHFPRLHVRAQSVRWSPVKLTAVWSYILYISHLYYFFM